MTYEQKKELCSNRNVILDGKPAVINGALTDFAMVRQLGGYGFEWAWETVKYVVENKEGRFQS